MLIAIVRHGETIENSQRIIQGHLPGHLSETGKNQAKLLGQKLGKLDMFDQIISSDLERAKETSMILANELNQKIIHFEKELRERNYGVLEGQPIIRLKRMLVVEKTDLQHLNIHNGENYDDFEKRVLDFFQRVIEQDPSQKTIVVTHAGVIRILLKKIAGITSTEINNCGGYLIALTKEKKFEINQL